MNLLIKPSFGLSEEIDLILALGDRCQIGILQNLYLDLSKKPNFLVIAEDELNQDVKNATEKYGVGIISVSPGNYNIFWQNKKKNVKIPRVANILKYKPMFPDWALSSDLYIHCLDEQTVIQAQNLCRQNKKIKVSSLFPIHCPNFVGIVNPEEIVKLASSAKVTIVNNQILMDSLLFNGACAISFKDYFAMTPNEDYVLEQKQQIQPIQIFMQSFYEELSNINR